MRILCATCAITILVSGCASAPPRNNPVPDNLIDEAIIPGMPYARAWADVSPQFMERWLKEATEEEFRAEYGGIMNREHNYLAISGGGANGAFGAGLLNGWSESGTRPEFTIVTGISTGGLIAPFAFLGTAYDEKLEEMYTLYATSDLVERRSTLRIVRNDAIFDTTPMRELIQRYVSPKMMQEIAVEYRKGRMLLIGTTNIDTGRPVMWDIGRIADRGGSASLDLIRDIMLASAAIPVAFPPVTIDVEVNGRRYEEMHVDGGVTSQVFLYPLGLDWATMQERLNVQGRPNLYVIRNAHLDLDWSPVQRRLLPIAGRTIGSLIRTQGLGDLFRLYLASIRDGLHFHLAFIPEDFDQEETELFDRKYMRDLFERGRSMAYAGFPWLEDPYGLEETSEHWRPD